MISHSFRSSDNNCSCTRNVFILRTLKLHAFLQALDSYIFQTLRSFILFIVMGYSVLGIGLAACDIITVQRKKGSLASFKSLGDDRKTCK